MPKTDHNVTMYMWTKDMVSIYNANKNDQANLWQAYGTTIGKCMEVLHNKLDFEGNYEYISSSGNFI